MQDAIFRHHHQDEGAAAVCVSLLFISSLIMSSLLNWDKEGAYISRYQAIWINHYYDMVFVNYPDDN